MRRMLEMADNVTKVREIRFGKIIGQCNLPFARFRNSYLLRASVPEA